MVISMSSTLVYVDFVNYRMNYGNIEPSLVGGWLEVKLLGNSRFLWSLFCEEGAWV